MSITVGSNAGQIDVGNIATIFFEFPDENNIDFLIEGNYRGWFGLGFDYTMTNTDMVICEIISN